MSRLLYKYCKANDDSFSSIKENYLFFSNPQNFNDPFDSNLNYLLNTDFLKDDGELDFKKSVETLKGRLGISCLTERDDNLHMWSHYADGHTGLCIGYDMNIIEEHFSKNAMGIEAQKILYISKPLRFDKKGFWGFDREGKEIFYQISPRWEMKNIDKITESLILQKNDLIWKNEEEHRMIAHPRALQIGLENNNIVKIGDSGYKIYLPDNAIRKVVLGCKINLSYEKEINKILLRTTSLHKAIISDLNWAVKVI